MGTVHDAQAQLEAIEGALDDGDYEQAAELASNAVREHPGDVDLLQLYAEALWSLQDFTDAREIYRQLTKHDADVAEWWAALAQCHFMLLEFDAAGRDAKRANEIAEIADAYDVLGRLAERDADLAAADRACRRAHEIDSEAFIVPHRLPEEAFRLLVQEALDDIPARFRHALDSDVAILVEPTPALDLLRGGTPPLSPDLLGLYVGTPLPERASSFSVTSLPDRVYLFQRNIEHVCATRDEVIEQVRITVVHELGHYFGFSDEDLEERDFG